MADCLARAGIGTWVASCGTSLAELRLLNCWGGSHKRVIVDYYPEIVRAGPTEAFADAFAGTRFSKSRLGVCRLLATRRLIRLVHVAKGGEAYSNC